jgi:PhnB protein
MAKAKQPVPEGFHTVTPVLTLDDAKQAIDWYKKAFGAEQHGEVEVGPDGKVMHAELKIGDSLIMLHDAMGNAKDAKAMGGSPLSLWLFVKDCDTVFNRAIKAGARVNEGPMGQMADQFWGDRAGVLTDPHGYSWTIATRKEDLTRAELKERSAEFMKQFAPAHT